MSRSTGTVRLLATALVLAVGSALLVPLCTMPACEDTGTVACADFQPACDDCPPTVVMKHDHGDAVSVNTPAPADLVATPIVTAPEPVTPMAFALAGPVPTASPPPLDPLGVRLLV